jgi:hypothetical protein
VNREVSPVEGAESGRVPYIPRSQRKNIIHAPEMSEDANGRFTFLAEGFDDAVVADTVRVAGLKRCH